MSLGFGILLVLHLIGWAIALGELLSTMKRPRVLGGVLHGLYLALLTGVAMWVWGEVAGYDPDPAKMVTKLVATLAMIAMGIYGKRQADGVSKGYLGAFAGLIVINVCIAVLWT